MPELAFSTAAVARWLPLIWVGFIVYSEILQFHFASQRCHWPLPPSVGLARSSVPLDTATHANTTTTTPFSSPLDPTLYRIAIIADPQITDYYSYRHTGLLLSLTNFFTDQYATKNYWYLLQAQRPDAVLILGDLFDGGRHWEDVAWYEELDRFRRIFRLADSPQQHGRDRESTPQLPINTNTVPSVQELGDPPASVLPAYHYRPLFRYVAGNHDIGVGATIIPAAVTRFIREFGPLNYRWSVAGHDLLILDNLSLENTSIPELAANSTAFLDQMEREILSSSDSSTAAAEATSMAAPHPAMAPRLLFTHIPLYRPPHTDCGPRRNRGHEINQKFGFQYQNLVREPITNRILRQTQPEVVFTGDDHDQCEVTHTISPPPLSQLDRDEVNRTIPEYTLGSYSMAGGNTRPSYTLLTLHHHHLLPHLAQTSPLANDQPEGNGITSTASINARTTSDVISNPDRTWAIQICLLPDQVAIFIRYGGVFILTVLFLGYRAYRQVSTRYSQHRLRHPQGYELQLGSIDDRTRESPSNTNTNTLIGYAHKPPSDRLELLRPVSGTPTLQRGRYEFDDDPNTPTSSNHANAVVTIDRNSDYGGGGGSEANDHMEEDDGVGDDWHVYDGGNYL
ncbi:hypothetical protein H4R33_005626 [Dimargaris cristalligena]|nr:hypothetical protein H4R33_005626 [Dimargaris cristalligena]